MQRETTEAKGVNDQPKNEPNLLAKQADALAMIAQAYLSGSQEKTSSSADHYQVMVHVDEAALRKETADNSPQAKSDLPIESVRRLCCDGNLVPIVKNDHGKPLNAGRKHRVVQPALRRALLARDQCCRFPGCTHDKWLDAHHVMHWIDGGETSLSNTIMLCSTHHRLLHEGGFSIQKDFSGEWYFKNERGRAIVDASAFRAKVVETFEVGEPPAPYVASRDANTTKLSLSTRRRSVELRYPV